MSKTILALLFLLFPAFFAFSQIDLEIDDGMLIETNGGFTLEISGVLIEKGTGYFKGKITSGDRDSISEFAGLTIFSGTVNKITRTTGSAISTSSPKTSLRNYELDNYGSAFISDVASTIVINGSNDESNGIVDKFIFKEQYGTWVGYSDNGSESDFIIGADVNIPANSSNIVVSEGIGVGAAIFLEGPYNASSDNMNNSINGNVLSVSPYSEAPRTGAVPSEAVDWVLVELRSGISAVTSLGFRSAFVDANGNIIDDFGNPGIGFPAAPGSSYLIIKHRNHLPVMSSGKVTYDWISN